jgi:acyl carrier protein
MNEIVQKLNDVFREVFMKKDLVITAESDASTVDGWDSLTHMMLISETEKRFNITFTFNEIMAFRNAGDIMVAILKHLSK